jgi:hypothetical protein
MIERDKRTWGSCFWEAFKARAKDIARHSFVETAKFSNAVSIAKNGRRRGVRYLG